MIFSGWTELDIPPRADDMRPLGEGRAEGLHLSTVIRSMREAAGDPTGAPEGDQEGVRLQEGFLWERAVEYMFAGFSLDEALELAFKRFCLYTREGIVKQLVLERDGIHMTPDGIDGKIGRLESYKATRRSLRKALDADGFRDNFWSWHVQEMSYALAAGVDECRWIVLWAAGDYSRGVGSGPRVLECTVQWTHDELVANWNIVLAHAKGLR